MLQRYYDPIASLEWLTESYRLKIRATVQNPPPTGEVVLLAVDESSLLKLSSWPFPRTIHGQLIEWLGRDAALRPAVLGWDFVFHEEDHIPAIDEEFSKSLINNSLPVVMGALLDPGVNNIISHGDKRPDSLGLTEPLPASPETIAALKDQAGIRVPLLPLLPFSRFGFLNADADADGVVRQVPMLGRVRQRVFPSLVLQILMQYWRTEPKDVTIKLGEAIILQTPQGEKRIPINEQGFYRLNYRYELLSADFQQGIPELSYSLLYRGEEGDEAQKIKKTDGLLNWALFGEKRPEFPLAGRIVLVGQTAAGLVDIGPSPLTGQSAKVLVHINALENILRGDYLRPQPTWPGLVLMLLAGLGLAWILETKGFRTYLCVLPVVVLGFNALACVLLFSYNFMVPMALPMLGFGLQQTLVTTLKIGVEQARRDRIRRFFSSYVSPALVGRMVESGEDPLLGGHETEITCFFSDIQGFSAFSEILSPIDLVELLNQYLGGMTDILMENGGALDKYIGDAIVAMFGGLVTLPDHSRRACETAARMQLKQAELRARWQSEGTRWPPLVHAMRTRIGLNSGPAVVGNMGSQHRFNYTMMGDTVNIAARCESGAKTFGVYTMVTGDTVRSARAQGCTCVFRELDRIVVKGRSSAMEVYELTALSPEHLPEGGARCLELFAEGRALYLSQEWDAAIEKFTAAATLEPLQPHRDPGVENNASLVMIERCEKYRAHPPGPNWDGINRMSSK